MNFNDVQLLVNGQLALRKQIYDATLTASDVNQIFEALGEPSTCEKKLPYIEVVFQNCQFAEDAFTQLPALNALVHLKFIRFHQTILTFDQIETLISATILLPNPIHFSMILGQKHSSLIYQAISELINNYSNYLLLARDQWRMVVEPSWPDEVKELIGNYHNLIDKITLHKLRFARLFYPYRIKHLLELEMEKTGRNVCSGMPGEWKEWEEKWTEIVGLMKVIQGRLGTSANNMTHSISSNVREMLSEFAVFYPEGIISEMTDREKYRYYSDVDEYYRRRHAFLYMLLGDQSGDQVMANIIQYCESLHVSLHHDEAEKNNHYKKAMAVRPFQKLLRLAQMGMVISFAAHMRMVKPLVENKKMLDRIINPLQREAFLQAVECTAFGSMPANFINDIGTALVVLFEERHDASINKRIHTEEAMKDALRILAVLHRFLAANWYHPSAKLVFCILHYQVRAIKPVFTNKNKQKYREQVNVKISKLLNEMPAPFDENLNPFLLNCRRNIQEWMINQYYRGVCMSIVVQRPHSSTKIADQRLLLDTMKEYFQDMDLIAKQYFSLFNGIESENEDLNFDLYSAIAVKQGHSYDIHYANLIYTLTIMMRQLSATIDVWINEKDKEKCLTAIQLRQDQVDYAVKIAKSLLLVDKKDLAFGIITREEFDETLADANAVINKADAIKNRLQLLKLTLTGESPMGVAYSTPLETKPEVVNKTEQAPADLRPAQAIEAKPQPARKKQLKAKKESGQKKPVTAKSVKAKPVVVKEPDPFQAIKKINDLIAQKKHTEAASCAKQQIDEMEKPECAEFNQAKLALLYSLLADCTQVTKCNKEFTKEVFEIKWAGYDYAKIALSEGLVKNSHIRDQLEFMVDEVEKSVFFKEKAPVTPSSQKKKESQDDDNDSEEEVIAVQEVVPVAVESEPQGEVDLATLTPSIFVSQPQPEITVCPILDIKFQIPPHVEKLVQKLKEHFGEEAIIIFGGAITQAVFMGCHPQDTPLERHDIDIAIFVEDIVKAKALLIDLSERYPAIFVKFHDSEKRDEFFECVCGNEEIDIILKDAKQETLEIFAARRDIKLSSFVAKLNGDIYDYQGALTDIQEKTVRFVPNYWTNCDATSLLNYLRKSYYPNFKAVELHEVRDNAGWLLSEGSRILLNHFQKHFRYGHAVQALQAWLDNDIFKVLFPHISLSVQNIPDCRQRLDQVCQQLDEHFKKFNAKGQTIPSFMAGFLQIIISYYLKRYPDYQEILQHVMLIRYHAPLLWGLTDDEVAQVADVIFHPYDLANKAAIAANKSKAKPFVGQLFTPPVLVSNAKNAAQAAFFQAVTSSEAPTHATNSTKPF